MNILLVLPNDDMAGAEQYLKMIAEYYQDKGRVEIFFLNPKSYSGWDSLQDSVKFYYSKYNNKILIVLNFLIWTFKKKTTYQYVYTSHVYITGLIGICTRLGFLKRKYHIARESTTIFSRFSGIKLQTYKFFYHAGYSPVDLLICQTEIMRDQLLQFLPKLTRKVKVVTMENPIDHSAMVQKSKETVPVKYTSDFIVAAGRMIPLKGFDNLIRAFSNLKKVYPDLELIILGKGEEYDNLLELIEELGIKGAVHFPGFVDNVYPYFKKAKACVISSEIEGFPNVLLQMMSQNSKVVSTLCAGGIEDIPGIFTCAIKDVDELEASIHKALSSEVDNRKLFDDFLANRGIVNFIRRINDYIHNSTS